MAGHQEKLRAKADWRGLKMNGRKAVASRVNSFEDASWLTRGRSRVGREGSFRGNMSLREILQQVLDASKDPREEE